MHILGPEFAEAIETPFIEIAYGTQSNEKTNKNTDEKMYK